jgi:DNA polymerase-3 subunit epsilon
VGLFGSGQVDGYAVLDFETTGLSSSSDRVVEVAVVHVSLAGKVTSSWTTLVNPGTDSVGATEIHGVEPEDVLGAPSFADLAPGLLGLLSNRVLVAHNAKFDVKFLAAEARRAGLAAPTDLPVLCTMETARKLMPRLARHTLESCCAEAKVRNRSAHAALSDATATAELLAYFLRKKNGAKLPEWKKSLAAPFAPPGRSSKLAKAWTREDAARSRRRPRLFGRPSAPPAPPAAPRPSTPGAGSRLLRAMAAAVDKSAREARDRTELREAVREGAERARQSRLETARSDELNRISRVLAAHLQDRKEREQRN